MSKKTIAITGGDGFLGSNFYKKFKNKYRIIKYPYRIQNSKKFSLWVKKNNFEIFNCTYGKSFRVVDVIKRIIKNCHKDIKIIHDLKKPSIPVNILVSSNKANKLLNWRRQISLDEGIKKTITWVKNNI